MRYVSVVFLLSIQVAGVLQDGYGFIFILYQYLGVHYYRPYIYNLFIFGYIKKDSCCSNPPAQASGLKLRCSRFVEENVGGELGPPEVPEYQGWEQL